MSSAEITENRNVFSPQLLKLAPYYLLILAVAIFYSNVYDNAFLYDDDYLIRNNLFLRDWHHIGSIFTSHATSGAFRTGHFYRPLQNLLYLVVYQIAGPSLFAFHAVNLILHAANACLMYTLGRKMTFNTAAAFFAALIWALHPIHTEAVTYMSATADLLFVFFSLSALVFLLPDFASRKFLLATPLFILALLSKETAIIFPLLAIACMDGLRVAKKTYLRTWPFWAVVLIYMMVRFVILHFHSGFLLNTDPNSKLYAAHVSLRLWTFLATLPSYLQLLVWPVGLHMDRDFPLYLDPWQIEVYTGIVIVAASIMQIIWNQRVGRRRTLAWGLMWFFAAEIPQSGIFIPVNSLFLEHWMYLPTIGLFLGTTQAISRTLHQPIMRYASAVCASLIALILGCLTYMQNEIWHDPIVFYNNILNHGESSVRSRNNLAVAYMDRGDYQNAMEQFQLALKDYDITPETHQNLAALFSRLPDGHSHIDEEISELNKAIVINPDFWNAYVGLADIYAFKGDQEKAASYRQKANEIRSRMVTQ